MPLQPEALEILNSVIKTPEDQTAFEAGYELGNNPDSNAFLSGPVVRQLYGGVQVEMNMADQTGTWIESRKLPRSGDRVLVSHPAFVLGAVVAALESHAVTREPSKS